MHWSIAQPLLETGRLSADWPWLVTRERSSLNTSSAVPLSSPNNNTTDTVTYDPLVGVVSAAVRCSQSGGALLGVPRGQALLGRAADWDGVDAVCVAVTVTVIALASTVTWCPNKDRAFPTTALQKREREREVKTMRNAKQRESFHGIWCNTCR